MDVDFLSASQRILDKAVGLYLSTAHQKFYCLFGVKPELCNKIWVLLLEKKFTGQTYHLLWGLLILKVYATEDVHCTIAKTSAKTFRKWSWNVVYALADLQIVSRTIVFFNHQF